jgi:hypothetical protein
LRDLQLGTEGETDSHGLKVEDVEISWFSVTQFTFRGAP